MAVWSIVKVSQLEGAKRLDAEYYRPVHLRKRHFLRSLPRVRLGDVAFITDGQHGYHKVDPLSPIKHITAKCVVGNLIEVDDADRLSVETHLKNKRSQCAEGDVILTTAGTIGNAGVVTHDVLPANMDQDVARLHIQDKEKLSPWYLSVFLNSSFGRLQTTLETTGQVQGHLALGKVRTIEVPVIPLQRTVEEMAIAGCKERQRAKSLYLQAERMVLEELGWDALDLSQPKWWSVPLSKARDVHRLDADHFQPKYDKLIAHIKATGRARPLGEIAAPIHRGLQPTYVEEGEIVVVNSQHLGRYLLNVEATERTDEKFWQENKKARLQINDVLLYSTGAYIGRTNTWLETKKGIASNHVTIIRPGSVCDPLYLSVFLNSPPGLLQAEKWATGSGQREIYPDDIARFLIHVPSDKVQQKVADLVQQSYQARQKAKTLLDEAKAKVEALIENMRNNKVRHRR